MQVKDIQAGQGKIDVTLDVVSVDEARTFEKFGKSGKVANAKAKDESGEIKLTLWNEQADQVKSGMKVKITNGWCGEYQGERQLSTGKFGQLEVLAATEPTEAPAEVPEEAPIEAEEPAPEDFEEQ
jgi:replication factor A1